MRRERGIRYLIVSDLSGYESFYVSLHALTSRVLAVAASQ
jgi:hypothetical protein